MTKSTTYYWVLAALMSVITLIASYVVVPFGVIPFTLQTMAVVLTGLLIPRKYAAVAMFLNAILLFIFKGAFIYSPSFGFIIGFIVAMMFASQNPGAENGWKILTIRAIGMNLIIFLCGLTYMYSALNYLLDSPILDGHVDVRYDYFLTNRHHQKCSSYFFSFSIEETLNPIEMYSLLYPQFILQAGTSQARFF